MSENFYNVTNDHQGSRIEKNLKQTQVEKEKASEFQLISQGKLRETCETGHPRLVADYLCDGLSNGRWMAVILDFDEGNFQKKDGSKNFQLSSYKSR